MRRELVESRHSRVREGKLRIERDRLIQEIDLFEQLRPGAAWRRPFPDEQLIGGHVRGRPFADARLLFERHRRLQRLRDPQRDVALRREDVDALAIVLVRPDHLPGACVHQLDVDAHA
jgi:hypothetical protein